MDAIVRGDINRLPCVFAKALLARGAVCELAERRTLGEAESAFCRDPLARAACGTLAGLLREKSAFALKLRDTTRTLTHAMSMRIQCGGLAGLRDVLDPGAPAPDIHGLVRRAQAEYGALEALPFSRIVQGVAAWRRHARPEAGA